MKSINKNLLDIEQSITVEIADKVREMEQKGIKVIKFQTGEPDFPTPKVIIDSAYKAMREGLTKYSASRGLPQLREAIANKLKQENGLEYDPAKEILVTHGGVHGVFVTIHSLINKGDEVLIIDPCWMPYVSIVTISGGIPIRIPTVPEKRFKISPQEIEKYITKKTKMLILNNPCNPSGALYSENELKELARLIERYDLYVLADEVYEKIIFDGFTHTSFASIDRMKQRTILVNSFSKTYAMTGWRIGYIATDASLLSQILKMSQYSITNVCTFNQFGAITALTNDSVKEFVEHTKEIYERRRNLLVNGLNSIDGINAIMPQGTFYVMVDISSYNRSSVDFANFLLEKAHIATVPGVGFGKCTEGFIRMHFAISENEIEEAIERMRKLLK